MEAELNIDPEFEALCPEQSAEELSNLEFSLERDGCLNPIITWANHDDIILDGHTRYRICTREKIAFKTKALKLETREDAVNWIIAHQLGRRNLSDEQKSYLRGKRYLSEKLAAHRPEKKVAIVATLAGRTEERLSQEYGVSPKTIRNDAEFAKSVDAIASVDPEAKKKILSGKSGASRKEVAKVASLPKDVMQEAVGAMFDAAACLTSRALKEGKPKIKSEPDKIIESIERAIEQIGALAAREMSRSGDSQAAVACLKDAISHIKKWRKPQR